MSAEPPGDLAFDLSGVGVRVTGLSAVLAERLASDWGPFHGERAEPAFLVVDVEVAAGGRPPAGPFDPKSILGHVGAGGARYEMPDGTIAVGEDGHARAVLAAGEGARAFYAFMNLVRAALAWRMLARGGALLHAAGVVLDGRAFVLAGPAGSGKTTWAALGEAAGATVLSDDLVLLDGARGRAEALGAPFRSTHPRTAPPGRWPLAAILFPARGAPPRLDPVKELEARAQLLANLPFVAEGLESDARVERVVESLVTGVPVQRLTFAPDPGFVDLLRGPLRHERRD